MAPKTETMLDMHNQLTGKQLEELLKIQLRALEKDPAIAKILPPLMVWGAPGLGKSTIIRSVADEFGIGFIDVRLAQREPVDVRGLPVPDRERKCVDWFVSGEWPREGRGILLFDELTAADRSLQVAAYELILDRRLGGLYSVPDGWYICAAGNRVDDAAVAGTMSSALANRFMHAELVSDVTSWAEWAVTHGIHPAIIGFLRFRPECLFRQEGENLERGWPTPRSWERVSAMLGIIPEEKQELRRKTVYGLIGNRAGLEFCEFLTLDENLENARKMMLNPQAEVVIPVKVDRKYALCSAMSYYVWRGKNDKEQAALLDGFFRITLQLSSDFACMTLCDAMTGCGVLTREEAESRLFHHPAYKGWMKAHGAILRKYRSL